MIWRLISITLIQQNGLVAGSVGQGWTFKNRITITFSKTETDSSGHPTLP